MSGEDNKAVVRRFVEEVQVKGNLAVIDELFSADYIDHSGLAGSEDLEATKRFFQMFAGAFADQAVTIDDQIAEGDKVVTRKVLHGTHVGSFMGIPPTGKRLTVQVIDIFRVSEGKIAEHWAITDRFGMMQQLGMMPAPGGPGGPGGGPGGPGGGGPGGPGGLSAG